MIVFETCTVTNTGNRQRRFIIKIADGVIVEYKGVTSETITFIIKPLAISEDYRVEYMPNVDLILDSTKKLISTPFNSEVNYYIITGAFVEQCTCTS